MIWSPEPGKGLGSQAGRHEVVRDKCVVGGGGKGKWDRQQHTQMCPQQWHDSGAPWICLYTTGSFPLYFQTCVCDLFFSFTLFSLTYLVSKVIEKSLYRIKSFLLIFWSYMGPVGSLKGRDVACWDPLVTLVTFTLSGLGILTEKK